MIPLLLLAAQPTPLTHAEVARHDTQADCWTVIEGQVYDITPWISQHPGGPIILRACGKDATYFFQHRSPEGGHKEVARTTLQAFHLGALGEVLGEQPDCIELPPIPHDHDLRLAGTRGGLLPTASVGPKRSVALRVGHNVSFGDAPSGIAIGVGYSTGRLDLMLSDYRAVGLGGLEAKYLVLDEHRAAPLSLAVQVGGGFSSVVDAPALHGLLLAERSLLDRRLRLSAMGLTGISPGLSDSLQLAAGGGVEFRPLPIHGIFGEVIVPMSDPSSLAWSAGARIYTSAHTFTLYVSSTPTLSPWALAGPAVEQLSIGMAFERAFEL